MHNIFLSYSRRDTEIMQRVKQSFHNAGFKVWTDEGIEAGTEDWQKAIEKAIKETNAFVCLCSPDAKDSRWVKAELKHAELRKKSIFLILMRGDELDSIPFGYQHHQYIDIRVQNDYETNIKRLISTIQQKLGTNIRKPTVKELLPPPFDWCEIPAGKVTLGEGFTDTAYSEGQTFDVPSFLIAKFPITIAQYARFIESDGYKNKHWWTKAGWTRKESKQWTEPRFWRLTDFNQAKQPVVGVSWYESIAFCLWLSEITGEAIMLPTEQQWQRAAQGNDGRIYPWGNDVDKTRANTRESGLDKTTLVDAYPNGVSPFEVFDMVGNVDEWCLTEFETGNNELNTAKKRVMRGGSYLNSQDFSNTLYREYWHPAGSNEFGFRICAALD